MGAVFLMASAYSQAALILFKFHPRFARRFTQRSIICKSDSITFVTISAPKGRGE
jgi:hypothetical protein